MCPIMKQQKRRTVELCGAAGSPLCLRSRGFGAIPVIATAKCELRIYFPSAYISDGPTQCVATVTVVHGTRLCERHLTVLTMPNNPINCQGGPPQSGPESP